jgi:hypothetical protein
MSMDTGDHNRVTGSTESDVGVAATNVSVGLTSKGIADTFVHWRHASLSMIFRLVL